MKAECVMMWQQEGESADNWYWGRCTIWNMADMKSMSFEYGSKFSVPNDGLGRFGVISAVEQGEE